ARNTPLDYWVDVWNWLHSRDVRKTQEVQYEYVLLERRFWRIEGPGHGSEREDAWGTRTNRRGVENAIRWWGP
ncbi:hypothetical protein BJV78DRAFT_1353924, partial [Lactifluus subvellereus]